MASRRAHGPVQVIYAAADGKLQFNYEAASKVLLQNGTEKLPIMVVSVAGATRTGKSFLLSFFLRYLQNENELLNTKVPLEGFSWAGGTDRHTTGIWFWSKIFKVRTSAGPVGILLMDTQGVFDVETTYQDNVTVFALSTLISSVQIYNLSNNLKEDDLEHLQMFTEYGRMALDQSSCKPFQRLIFLIRDWFFTNYAHGFHGGETFLNKQMSETGKPEAGQKLRQYLKASFTDLSCFLMPFPGKNVASCEHVGLLEDIEPEFLAQLKALCSTLFNPENLTIKTMCGKQVIASDLLEYMKMYSNSDIFKGNMCAKSFYQATAEALLFTLKRTCREKYVTEMGRFVKTEQKLNLDELKTEHDRVKNRVLDSFRTAKKFGDKDLCERFKLELELELNQIVATYEIKVYYRLMREIEQQKKELAEKNKLTKEKAEKMDSEMKELKQEVEKAKEKAGPWYEKFFEAIVDVVEGLAEIFMPRPRIIPGLIDTKSVAERLFRR